MQTIKGSYVKRTKEEQTCDTDEQDVAVAEGAGGRARTREGGPGRTQRGFR